MSIIKTSNVKVAICIPSYNNEISLKRLLDSINIQTCHDYIVIITDDTEDDHIERMVSGYRSLPIHYIHNKKRLGPTVNCNKAISISKRFFAKYLKVMHHDDFFSYPESLSKMVKILDQQPEVDLVFTGAHRFNERNSYPNWCISDKQVKCLTEDYRYVYIANVIGAPSATLVRNLDDTFDEKLIWLVDVEWYLRILHNNPQFAYTKEPLISIGISDKQLTNQCIENPELIMKEYLYVYQKLEFLHEQIYSMHAINMVWKHLKY